MNIAKKYRPELLVSTDQQRPQLTDPYLDVRAERVVATNGHALVAVPVETDKGERSRYLATPLLQAARKLGKDTEPAVIEDQEIRPYGVLWPTDQEGRTFPDWKAVVPPFRRGSPGTVSIALDATLLAALAKAMSSPAVVITFSLGFSGDDPGPIVVQPRSKDAEELGVLMPMRAEGTGDVQLDDDQVCPVCRKVLASGAWCEKHGNPKEARALLAADRERAREAAAQSKGALPPLAWETQRPGRDAAPAEGGVYALKVNADGTYTSAWLPDQGRAKHLAVAKPLEQAKAACERHRLETAGDRMLKNAGAGELVKADLRGDATARKPRKGGARA